MIDVWVVCEPDDHGEPVVYICETEADAHAMAAKYRKEYPGSEPRVDGWEFDRP